MKISVSFGRLYSCINQDETKENLNEAKQTEESKSLLIFYVGGTKFKNCGYRFTTRMYAS